MSRTGPFPLRDYTLTHRATGLEALTHRELRERVRAAPAASLFLHFWGRLTRPGWQAGEYGNDLANWASASLHDPVLAERLALVDPRLHPDTEGLRRRVLEVLEERLEEPDATHAEAREGEAFHFLVTHVVVYRTGTQLGHPGELPDLLPRLPTTTLLHHFVDAPGSPIHRGAELRGWLRRWSGAARDLADRLETVDHFLHGQEELRRHLVELAEATLGNGAGKGAGRGTGGMP